MKKSILLVFILGIIINLIILPAFSEDVPFLALFDHKLNLVSWTRSLTSPRCAIKLKNGNYLVGDHFYFVELIPNNHKKEPFKVYLARAPFSVGEFSNGNRLFLDNQALGEYSITGKKIRDIKKNNKIDFALLFPNDNILIVNRTDPIQLQLIDKNGNLIWAKDIKVRMFSHTYNNNILVLSDDSKTLQEIDSKGNVLNNISFKKPISSAVKIDENRYVIILCDTNTVELVDKTQQTLKKIENVCATGINLLNNGSILIFGSRAQSENDTLLLKFQ